MGREKLDVAQEIYTMIMQSMGQIDHAGFNVNASMDEETGKITIEVVEG